MILRRRLTRFKRAQILARQDGRCALCDELIDIYSIYEIDHAWALGLGGGNEDDNLRAVHVACHKTKTVGDIGRIAKVKRGAEKHERHLTAMMKRARSPNARQRLMAKWAERRRENLVAERQE